MVVQFRCHSEVQCIILEILCVSSWVVAEKKLRDILGTAFTTANSHVMTGSEFADFTVMVVISQLVQ